MYDRTKKIGASDAVPIMAGEWLDLYKRKTSPDALSRPLAAEIGKATESLNRDWFSRETDKRIAYRDLWADAPLVLHGKNPDAAPTETHFQPIDWCVYTPDGLIDEHGHKIPFEAKAVNPFWKPENLIRKYMPQLQHAMRVMRAPYCYLSVFYLNIKWEYYKIPYDPAYDERLFTFEKAFYFYLKEGIEPPE